jgi:hypothetical protein
MKCDSAERTGHVTSDNKSEINVQEPLDCELALKTLRRARAEHRKNSDESSKDANATSDDKSKIKVEEPGKYDLELEAVKKEIAERKKNREESPKYDKGDKPKQL